MLKSLDTQEFDFTPEEQINLLKKGMHIYLLFFCI